VVQQHVEELRDAKRDRPPGIDDLVATGFDAGIRLGDAIEKDMVSAPITKRAAWSIEIVKSVRESLRPAERSAPPRAKGR
jgi:hypothetical protein